MPFAHLMQSAKAKVAGGMSSLNNNKTFGGNNHDEDDDDDDEKEQDDDDEQQDGDEDAEEQPDEDEEEGGQGQTGQGDEEEEEQEGQFGQEGEDEQGQEDDEEATPVRPTVAHTTSTPITSAEKQKASDRRHPPVKLYSDALETWHPMIALIDTGCDDDWISQSKVDELGLEDYVEDPDDESAHTTFTTFSGEEMSPTGQVAITWSADSTGKSVTTLAYITDTGPFDFLLGANFYWGAGGEDFFKEPLLILRQKAGKPSPAQLKQHQQNHLAKSAAGEKLKANRSAGRAQARAAIADDDEDEGLAKETQRLGVNDDESDAQDDDEE